MSKALLYIKIARKKMIFILSIILLLTIPRSACGQKSNGEQATEALVNLGFENVRWTENNEELIYTIENNTYKAQGVGIAKALEVIQEYGLPINKKCKVIVTRLEIPELAITYHPTNDENTNSTNISKWETSYDLGNSWKEIKKEKRRNSSRGKVDILIYPQLSYKNLIITQIYQVLFTLNPAIEVSFWTGMKLTAQVIIPIYNDGYGTLNNKAHPGFITLSQRFRLPFNIKGKATIGGFNMDRYGVDLMLFRPFKFDERFSLEGRIGFTSIGYWNGFHYHYATNHDAWKVTWTLGANFYWPKFNTEFSLKAEEYFLGEKGVKFEMIRNFRYASVGFYAVKAKEAAINANGGFRFQVLLPPYKQKRHKYIPRVSTSYNMGIVYNAGNERYYFQQYRSESNENIMNENSFNPYFIKSELSIY